jgi:hypothetical protein
MENPMGKDYMAHVADVSIMGLKNYAQVVETETRLIYQDLLCNI